MNIHVLADQNHHFRGTASGSARGSRLSRIVSNSENYHGGQPN
jgi:hypothetical protein